MRFVCTQENLYKGLNLVSHLSNRSMSLPILNNVLLTVEQGNLIVSATNLEIGVVTEIRGKAEKDGAFTVNAKVFTDYVNMLPKEKITLELKDEQLHISCGSYNTKIRGQVADEFPIIPSISQDKGYVVDSKVLKDALSQTTFAVSLDEMRPEITGVLTIVSEKQLLVVATDSYRLAEKKVALTHELEDKRLIIPLKTLQEVDRVINAHTEPEITFYCDENQIMFVCGATRVISRLIEGNFPNYEQIIPNAFSTSAHLNREELIQAIRTASLFTRSGVNDVVLSFKSDNNEIEITTTNSQIGEHQAVLAGEVLGNDLKVVFNYKYLLDGLQSVTDESVTIELSSSTTPAVLYSKKDAGYTYLIMPIKQ